MCHIGYLDQSIYETSMEVDDNKVEAMRQWATPKNLCAFCEFLRLTGYCRHFDANYDNIAYPLNHQLKKDTS